MRISSNLQARMTKQAWKNLEMWKPAFKLVLTLIAGSHLLPLHNCPLPDIVTDPSHCRCYTQSPVIHQSTRDSIKTKYRYTSSINNNYLTLTCLITGSCTDSERTFPVESRTIPSTAFGFTIKHRKKKRKSKLASTEQCQKQANKGNYNNWNYITVDAHNCWNVHWLPLLSYLITQILWRYASPKAIQILHFWL